MGRKCSVWRCKSGYKTDNSEKKSFFRFPSDPEERRKWLNAIPNKIQYHEVTNNMTVCSLHFKPSVKYKKHGVHKIPIEPPTIFDIHEKSCCGTSAPKKRETNNSTGVRIYDKIWSSNNSMNLINLN